MRLRLWLAGTLACGLILLAVRPAVRQAAARNRANLAWLRAVMPSEWRVHALWDDAALDPIPAAAATGVRAQLQRLPGTSPQVPYALAHLALQRGDDTAATAALERYLQARPDSHLAHNLLGTLYWRAGDRARATSHFQSTATGPPYLLRVAGDYLARSEAAALAGRSAEATALAAQARQVAWVALDALLARPLSPTDAYAHYLVGYQINRYWRTADDLRLALAYLNVARDLQPDYYPYHQAAGRAAYNLGDYALAQSILLQAIAVAPTPQAGDYYYLGQSAFAQAHYSEAARYFEQAVQAGLAQPNALNALGDAHRQLGNRARAEEAYTAVLAIDPHDPHARQQLDLLNQAGE